MFDLDTLRSKNKDIFAAHKKDFVRLSEDGEELYFWNRTHVYLFWVLVSGKIRMCCEFKRSNFPTLISPRS